MNPFKIQDLTPTSPLEDSDRSNQALVASSKYAFNEYKRAA